MQSWNILLVDDEPDVHEVTKLALKHRRWRKRPFELTSKMSMRDAIAMFENQRPLFQVAIVDVVMEKEDAGLRLCEYIRAHCPSSLRIILRTGQPGVAPEEQVLNEYDIDYYLAKSEATPDKLYSVIRACLRSSQDISTLLAFGRQLQSFCRALQEVTSVNDLLVFMAEALQFLELKHGIHTVFNYDLNAPMERKAWLTPKSTNRSVDEIRNAMRKALATGNLMSIHPGSALGLSANSFIIPFESSEQSTVEEHDELGHAPAMTGERIPGALYFDAEVVSEKLLRDVQGDAALFIDNWRIAYATLLLQERYAKERLLREKMYFERMQSIAKMVTGVAHELNTPLGVANTANSMLASLARDFVKLPPGSADGPVLAKDIEESCALMTRNLARTQTLIKSFKQLSASQLSDQRGKHDIVEVVRDCVESTIPETKKHHIAITVHAPDKSLIWDGYPSHLSQVVLNMIQNVIRYAYPTGGGGKMDIRISEEAAVYRLEFEDYGAGIAPEVVKSIFEPFVTSARGKGGTGLGLAISHNIVTNLLKGAIKWQSQRGSGTKFIIDVPRVVPEPDVGPEAKTSHL